MALAGWFIWIVCRSGLPALMRRRGSTRGALACAAFVGVLGILIHSSSDSNLHLPANASLFYVLASLVVALRSAAQ